MACGHCTCYRLPFPAGPLTLPRRSLMDYPRRCIHCCRLYASGLHTGGKSIGAWLVCSLAGRTVHAHTLLRLRTRWGYQALRALDGDRAGSVIRS